MKNITVSCEKGISINRKVLDNCVKILISYYDLKLGKLDFNFLNGESMIEINKKYLDHNYDTDIITFNYSDENDMLDGEFFISLSEASKNSKKYKVPLDNELFRLIVHGILHLIGYDDSNAQEKRRMKKVENQIVNMFNNDSKGLVTKYVS